MKKQYNGLEAMMIPIANANIITSSSGCLAMIQLELQNGICISPEWQQQIAHIGDQG